MNSQKIKLYGYEMTDLEWLVLQLKNMRMPEKKSLAYLADHGYRIHPSTYYRIYNRLKEKEHERLLQITKDGLENIQLHMLDTIMICEAKFWDEYHLCNDPYKRTLILDKIIEVQPWKSSLMETTSFLLEWQLNTRKLAEDASADSGPPLKVVGGKGRVRELLGTK